MCKIIAQWLENHTKKENFKVVSGKVKNVKTYTKRNLLLSLLSTNLYESMFEIDKQMYCIDLPYDCIRENDELQIAIYDDPKKQSVKNQINNGNIQYVWSFNNLSNNTTLTKISHKEHFCTILFLLIYFIIIALAYIGIFQEFVASNYHLSLFNALSALVIIPICVAFSIYAVCSKYLMHSTSGKILFEKCQKQIP